MIDPTRLNHKLRRLGKMIPDEDSSESEPLLSIVAPDLEPDPPSRFQSEEAFRDYFSERAEPALVVFVSASEAPEPDGRS